jgi:hypothetical protein
MPDTSIPSGRSRTRYGCHRPGAMADW